MCKKNPKAIEGNDDPKNLYINSNGNTREGISSSKKIRNCFRISLVYTEHMKWIPVGNQATKVRL